VFKLGRRPYSLDDGYSAFSRRTLLARLNATFRPASSANSYLARMYGQTGYEAVGYKLMLNQCVARPYLWHGTLVHGASVIHMTRRNVLKTLISRRAAAQSGVYHVSATLPVKSAVKDWSATAVTLHTPTLLRDLDTIAAETAQWKRLIASNRCFDLPYEEYVADQAGWNKSILGFLGASEMPLHSDLKKVNPDSLTRLVANFEEVSELLRGSDYAHCLEREHI
jgi:LPS sulfotransferase NodH